MAMRVGADDDELVTTINTTPLVDVMLVLLIIFLITVPVVTRSAAVELPREVNVPRDSKPENITIAVDRQGVVYWNDARVSSDVLLERLKAASQKQPQPQLQIRGDNEATFDGVAGVIEAAQRAGMQRLGFVTQPPPRGG